MKYSTQNSTTQRASFIIHTHSLDESIQKKVGDLKDNHRIGRPITETIHANIENDTSWTYKEIVAETILSRGTLE